MSLRLNSSVSLFQLRENLVKFRLEKNLNIRFRCFDFIPWEVRIHRFIVISLDCINVFGEKSGIWSLKSYSVHSSSSMSIHKNFKSKAYVRIIGRKDIKRNVVRILGIINYWKTILT